MSALQQLLSEILSQPEIVRPLRLERNGYLIRAGDLEHSIYYVEEGALRVFLVSEFEEHTIRFGYAGSILTSLKAFYDGQPSEYYIQAMRKCRLLAVRKTDFMDFIQGNEERMRVYQGMLEEFVLQMMEREIDLLTHSPVERFRRVQARSPQLFQEVPLKYIASYLRMTPETLSRIRNS